MVEELRLLIEMRKYIHDRKKELEIEVVKYQQSGDDSGERIISSKISELELFNIFMSEIYINSV